MWCILHCNWPNLNAEHSVWSVLIWLCVYICLWHIFKGMWPLWFSESKSMNPGASSGSPLQGFMFWISTHRYVCLHNARCSVWASSIIIIQWLNILLVLDCLHEIDLRFWLSVVLMLDHRLRRWPNIKQHWVLVFFTEKIKNENCETCGCES